MLIRNVELRAPGPHHGFTNGVFRHNAATSQMDERNVHNTYVDRRLVRNRSTKDRRRRGSPARKRLSPRPHGGPSQWQLGRYECRACGSTV